jgi:hypothetical protein
MAKCAVKVDGFLRYCLLLTVLVPLFLAPEGFCQTLSSIRGTITDATGAVVPGAEIGLVEVRTQVARRLISDDRGNYEVTDISPGRYRLTVELTGFKTHVVDNIEMESAQIRRVDARLQVGETSEQITVTEGLQVITTEGASISKRVEASKDYKELPFATVHGGPAAMLSMQPGVQGRGWDIVAVGQSSGQTTLSFDGLANDRTGNQQNSVPFLEEVVLRTVSVSAEQSRVVGLESVSKSGSNTFRGSVWYQHINSALNSRAYFDPNKSVFLHHNWQAEASGPIFKDKTFFYGSWISERYPAGSFVRITVPTAGMRQGDFSHFTGTLKNPLTGGTFPGNMIPANMLNPTALKIQELYIPEPNLGGAGALTNNLGYAYQYPTDKFQGDGLFGRLDHQLTAANSIALRVFKGRTPYVLSASSYPGFDFTRVRKYQRWQISDTHIFSPTLVNTFRFGWTPNTMLDGGEVDGFTPRKAKDAIAAIGLQGVNRLGFDGPGFPTMAISGITTLSQNGGGYQQNHTDYQWENALTWNTGPHVWKAGVQVFNWHNYSDYVTSPAFGAFSFNGGYTGVGYADFLLGLPFSSQRLDPLVPRRQSQNELGLFIQDTFKVTPQLTLDLGLRWDYYGSPSFEDGLQFNWDPDTGNVIVPAAAASRISPLYSPAITIRTGEVVPDPDMRNIRPRLGAAYRITDKLVVRGGYGAFTERIGYFSRANGGGPFQIAETYYNRIENGAPLLTFPNPFPSDIAAAAIPSQSVSGYPMKTDEGTIHQFNMSVEKQLGDMGLRASYIGNRSRGLNYSLNINKPRPSLTPFAAARRPFPQFVGANVMRNDGEVNFNSLQLEATRRAGALTFRGHYTLSTNRGNHFNLENPYDVTSHWANDNFTQRHRSVVNVSYDLPWGRGRRFLSDAPAMLDYLVGGWKLITVSYFATGSHFSPTFSGSDPSNTNTSGGLPDRLAEGNLPRGDRTMARWFDPSAFAVPQPGRFGNGAPNTLVGPGLNLHHLSILKDFHASERFVVNLTLAVSNIFNKGHFDLPRSNISTPRPGEVYLSWGDHDPEKRGSRKLQARLRVSW